MWHILDRHLHSVRPAPRPPDLLHTFTGGLQSRVILTGNVVIRVVRSCFNAIGLWEGTYRSAAALEPAGILQGVFVLHISKLRATSRCGGHLRRTTGALL